MSDREARVLIVMGSPSDQKIMEKCAAVLANLGVPHKMTVASAHRSPARALRLAQEARDQGVKVIIAAAGMAAHLAGVLASHTDLPVIGVPIGSGMMDGLDALLSTVQMPPGVPVATMGVDGAGARNAAYLAARILALSDPALAGRLVAHREEMAKAVEKAAAEMEGD